MNKLRGYNVLIVEDDPILLELVSKDFSILEKWLQKK